MNNAICNIWMDFRTTHDGDSGYIKFNRERDRIGDKEIRGTLLRYLSEYFIPSIDTIERNNGGSKH